MKCPRCLLTTGALIGGIWLREPMVAMPGVEPRMGESKSRALPFGYIAIKKRQISLSLGVLKQVDFCMLMKQGLCI